MIERLNLGQLIDELAKRPQDGYITYVPPEQPPRDPPPFWRVADDTVF